ncbi:MAG: very short patch repair endonuclease [Verrucomicrobiaceae bacterium]|nr:very short patch repair endonuclease [Verrucomicrobiaceae bacterium]
MPDVFSKAKRSAVMSRIRSHGNKDTELRLAAVFRAQGITGWRRQVRLRLSGGGSLQSAVRPDFVFRRARVAVFVDGCFWHGCAEHYRRPKSRQKFWDAKIARNMEHDTAVTKALRKAGWRVLRLWEHELAKKREKRLLARLRRWRLIAE